MKLKSKSVGKILNIFLWVALVINAVVLGNLVVAQFIGIGQNFIRFDQFATILLMGVMILASFIYLFWIFKVHQDLKSLDENYPNTPWGAIRRIVIPFYNIYGLWNVYSTMEKDFKLSESTHKLGSTLNTLVPIYFILLFVTRGFNNYITDTSLNEISNVIWFLSYSFDFVLVIIFIFMRNIVSNGLMIRSEEKSVEEEEENLEEEVATTL
ncbi:hypothetical protein [Pontibacillus sp. HMF3514]|uniref:hypothetical protein n=1 Tax=Pontibacillus sp. HMF3514 TaxID=2692425 RepID=UPI00131FD76D|nr:hypothetical protein [Pontibacillus sp. HMF3514]QHE52846.1 hypothetical protein GS400_12800 [Pontibacillus sp. HMF3514]